MSKGDGGLGLLSGPDAGGLLHAVIGDRGWRVRDWRLEQIDHDPKRSTTATYLVNVLTTTREQELLVGLTVRSSGLDRRDKNAKVFVRDGMKVAAWIYPDDPELAGLPRVTYPSRALALFVERQLVSKESTVDDLDLRMVTYRPRRRAVVRAQFGERVWFAKVMRAGRADEAAERHDLLLEAGVPAPRVDALTGDDVLVLAALPGRPLSKAIFDEEIPVSAEKIIALLDSLPAAVVEMPRRTPWAFSVEHYASLVAANAVHEQKRLGKLVDELSSGLDRIQGNEPCHGDFHEGQVQIKDGEICGLLDVDTVGPGRRVDDLACLLAHLCTVQRMNEKQRSRVTALIAQWLPVFDERVDPIQLRLVAAAVAISLASGPYRAQERDWQRETSVIVDASEALIRAAGECLPGKL